MTGNDELYDDEVERRWSEGSSVSGVSPDLMDARQRSPANQEAGLARAATMSPWLIPFSAILVGPLAASLLTLLIDGDPPKARHTVAVICAGITAWVINVGVAMTATPLTAAVEGMVRLGVLVAIGGALWAMYVYWMKGKTGLDRQAVYNSAIVLFVLSLTFWIGRDTQWWIWLGR